MGFIYGVIGFLCAMGVFIGGYVVGSKLRPAVSVTSAAVAQPDEAELERIKKEREELEAEQRAFRALTGYTPDVAYGVAAFPLENDK